MTPATTFEDIAPSAIKPHPSNPRQHVGDVTELADSIKTQGVLEPLIVAPIVDAAANARHRWTLIAGHRRLAAAQVAKVKTVPAVVRADLDTTSRQIEAMLVENLHRVDLTAVEEGDAYQALLDLGEGYTQDKIAKATGRSKATVRDRLKVAKLPESIRDRVLPGQISLNDATAMAEFLDEPETIAVLEKCAGTHAFSWQLQSARDTRTRAKKLAATRKKLIAEGVTVLDEYTGEGPCVELIELVPADAWPTDPSDADSDDLVLDQFRQEHTTCPGHIAVLDRYSGDVEWCCTRPDLHPVDTTVPGAPKPVPAKAGPSPEEIQRQQDELDLRSAAKVRRAHLGKIVHAPDNEDLALDLLRQPWIPFLTEASAGQRLWKVKQWRALAEILYDAPDKVNDEDLPEQLLGTIRTLSLSALVVLDNIDLPDDGDLEQAQGYVWQGQYSNTKDWRARLVEDFGYEWSPVELRMLGETDPDEADNEDGVA